ncbi:hypothetical protein OIU77_011635 [Salix suchowensis]|uniref:Uncharacterized protein n=1 Tax=Salix suchowensis TaxID=1278906 RepID=A0ABQ9A0X7_9ROSI|nr:hypothetical protein OIU77_011635 [Salix suchowensis]
MAFDILSRLPRFMCACKAWLGQIENPSFITDHYNKALKSYFRSRRDGLLPSPAFPCVGALRSKYQPDQINLMLSLAVTLVLSDAERLSDQGR